MQHRGYLQFEDQPAERRARGSIDFVGETFAIRVGDTIVSEVPAHQVRIELSGEGTFRIDVEGNQLLFDAEDASAVEKDVATHEFRSRLKTPKPAASILPAPTTPLASALPAQVTPVAPLERQAMNRAVIHPPKNPGVAAVLSFLWPGLGQIYNGQILKAIVFIVVQIVNAFLITVLVGFVTGFVVWVWSLVDAYKQAETYNRGLAAPDGR